MSKHKCRPYSHGRIINLRKLSQFFAILLPVLTYKIKKYEYANKYVCVNISRLYNKILYRYFLTIYTNLKFPVAVYTNTSSGFSGSTADVTISFTVAASTTEFRVVVSNR